MSPLSKGLSSSIVLPKFQTKLMYLRVPSVDDYESWSSLRLESKNFLEPWEPRWSPSSLTRPSYKRRLRRYSREIRSNSSISFFIFLQETLLGQFLP